MQYRFSSSSALVLAWALFVGCGGTTRPGDAGADTGAVQTGDAAADAGPAPTLEYSAHAYTYIMPGTSIDPLAATATGDVPHTFVASGLPSGLGVDESTGAITGAPTNWSELSLPMVFDATITMTDGSGRKAAWDIAFTMNDTAATTHAVDIDTACAFCASPSPTNVAVNVGDVVVFTTSGGGEASVTPTNAAAVPTFDLIFVNSYEPSTLGINGYAGTTLSYTASGGAGGTPETATITINP
jgi:hypothetical protein